jgi:hypothetical protein
MPAPIALVEVTAQNGGPAITNVSECFPLLARQHWVPASQEIVLMGAEDIGQFGPMRIHRRSGIKSRSRASSGLGVERMATSATCR